MNYFIEQEHLPAGSIVEISAFSNTQVHEELQEAKISGYGWVYIYRSYSGSQWYVVFVPYNEQSYIYFNSYTTTNSLGWNQYWRRIPLSTYDPY